MIDELIKFSDKAMVKKVVIGFIITETVEDAENSTEEETLWKEVSVVIPTKVVKQMVK
jgi:hypothetical protein